MKLSTTRLLVNDMNASLTFYKDTLGLPLRFGDPDGEYVELIVNDEVSLALFGRTAMAEATGTTHLPASAPSQDNFTITFLVDDVDATVATLASRGLTPSVAPTDRPTWMMRTVHYRDPDGNLVEIHAGLPDTANQD